ncbi:MAG: hypothetical protein DRR19_29015 [Candidatus Parabeggiatoa sp. nov. 1]|nr:MAG: hypothetical protein DRR19_29015 [Gammaproteobacteria bacterium]
MNKIRLVLVYLTGFCLIVGSASSSHSRRSPPPKGHARFILIEGNKGVIALPRRELDRKHALYLIKQKCRRNGIIIKEAEEKVGIIEYNNAHKKTRMPKTEYRIHYECR